MSVVKPKRLGDLITFKRGYDLPEKDRVHGSYPVISSAGVSGCHNEFKAEGEGIVTGRYGTLGRMYYVDGKYWPHNTALYVKDFKGNDPLYIYYLLTCIGHISTSDKSAVPGVNRNELHDMAVPAIEDKNIQIAVRQLLKSIDKKIELNNKINAELEAMAKLIYDYWFVQFDFPDTNDKPYKSSGGKMVFNEELKREIPDGWQVKKIKDIASTGSGGTPLKSKKEYYDNGNIPWINSGEVNEPFITQAKKFITEFGVEKSSAKLFSRGTILMAMYGATAGKVSFINFEATTNQAICAINPHDENYNFYLKFGLEDLYDYLVSLSSGSARDNLSQAKIKELMFSIPTDEWLGKYHLKVQPMMSKILSNMKENNQLIALRDWLLPMLMNGQVTVKGD